MGLYVTNNPLVLEKAGLNNISGSLTFTNGFMDVLTTARDMIHKGHRLLSHPLSGSVKPGETPYKTIVLSKEAGSLDTDSLRIIEEAVVTARKFNLKDKISEKADKDFQLVDYTLIFDKTGGK